MTGYMNSSPDGLYIEDTGIVGELTTPGYRPVNVQKLKRFGQAKKLGAVPVSQEYSAKQAARRQYEAERIKDIKANEYRGLQARSPTMSSINSAVKKSGSNNGVF